MKKINIQKATKRTRFNRAREKKGSKYTFTNAIDGARPFRGVNKKHSTLGLNAEITEEEFARECKEQGAERMLKATGYRGEDAMKLLRSLGFNAFHAERLLKSLGLDVEREAPRFVIDE